MTDAADTIVLVHGLWLTPCSLEPWAARYRKAGYRVLAPAWPGMEADVEALNADPAPIAALDGPAVVEHYDGIVRALDRQPILMGHSFGGAVVQVLLDRGLGAAGVGIASSTVRDVRSLPVSTLRGTAAALRHPKGRAAPLTGRQFHHAFANTLSRERSDELHRRHHVPAATTILRQAVFAGVHRRSPVRVDFANARRAPLLLVGFGEDRVVPPRVSRDNAAKYDTARAPADVITFPGRPHFPAAPGWEEVADHALRWTMHYALPPRRDRRRAARPSYQTV